MTLADSLAGAAFFVSLVALIIAWVTLGATRRVPLEVEARRHLTELVRARVPDWKNKLPVVPRFDDAQPHATAGLRREALEKDAIFDDFVDHHLPQSMRRHEELWKNAIELEAKWVEEMKQLARKVSSFVEGRLKLSPPPHVLRHDWDGTEHEENDELATNVYWPGLLDLLMHELLTGRIRADFADHEAPWWSYPYEWRRSVAHVSAGMEGAEVPSDLLYGDDPGNRHTLATVDRANQRQVEALFGNSFRAELQNQFAAERDALFAIHSQLSECVASLSGQMDDLSIIPLLPATDCPRIRDAVQSAALSNPWPIAGVKS